MSSSFSRKDWRSAARRTALSPTQLVSALAHADGWRLEGSGDRAGIEKSFQFADYFETIAFVNAVAFIAHGADHHPDLQVHYNRCVVRLSTHDVQGVSSTDFECAARIDALLGAQP